MRNIGVFTPAFSGAFIGQILSETFRLAPRFGVHLTVVRTGANNASYESPLATGLCEAWLLILTPIHAKLAQTLLDQGRPLCSMASSALIPGCGSSRSDNAKGVQLAMDALLAQGHINFAFMGGLKGLDAQERRKAFLDYLDEHGLEGGMNRVVETTEFGMIGGETGVRILQDRGVPYTALIAGNDQNAAGAIRYLRNHGKRVPEDVAVIGYDNSPLSRDPEYQISTLDQHISAIVEGAFKDILERLENPRKPAPAIRITPRLVLRISSHASAPVDKEGDVVISTKDGLLTALVSSNELIRFLHDGKVKNEMLPLLTRLSLHASHSIFALLSGARYQTSVEITAMEGRDIQDKEGPVERFTQSLQEAGENKDLLVLIVPVSSEGGVESALAAKFQLSRIIEPLFLALVANEMEMICFAVERATMRDRLETLVERRTEELRKAQEALVLSAQISVMGPIVSGISHHMNTPLGNAFLATSTLKAKLGAPRESTDTLGLVDLLETSISRMARLIERFRQTTDIQVASRPVRFEASSTLAIALERFQMLHPRVVPRVELSGLPAELYGDAKALQEAILAMLDNAHEHGKMPGTMPEIFFLTKGEDSRLCLEVSDHGPGLEPELVQRLFQPFFTTRLSDMSGLGLTLVHNVVTTLFQGSIEVQTAPGQGFCIRCYLPLCQG